MPAVPVLLTDDLAIAEARDVAVGVLDRGHQLVMSGLLGNRV